MAKQYGPKKTFLKEVVIGLGFLSGLWIHLGFDPTTFVYALLQKILLFLDPTHTTFITTAFLFIPIVLTSLAIIGAYKRAGLWGLLAVALAFGAGLLLTLLSIPLLLAAIVIGYFAARR